MNLVNVLLHLENIRKSIMNFVKYEIIHILLKTLSRTNSI